MTETMKLIEAIIRPEKLHDVLHALYDHEVHGLTVMHVQGHGGEPEETVVYRGNVAKKELQSKFLLKIGVSEPFVERAVEAIMEAARTGEVGDGKIFVKPVERIYRIRTGEVDEGAVTPVR